MKKITFFALFIMAFGLFSCGNDDDNTSSDKIVGHWQFEGFNWDGEDIPLGECESQSNLEFKSNGNVIADSYEENFETEECENFTTTANWENTGDGTYEIEEDGEVSVINVIFSNNNNTFQIVEEDEFGVFTSTFVRI